MTLLWGFIFSTIAVYASNDIHGSQEMMRFQSLNRAQTLSEFESARQRFELNEAALLACGRELAKDRVPVNCYVVLKIDRNRDTNLRSRFQISATELADRCDLSAGYAEKLPRPEHLRLLPFSCVQKLRQRGRLLAYKLGRDIE